MSKLASRDVLGIIILFALEFSSLKGWHLRLDQIIHILKNENYHQLNTAWSMPVQMPIDAKG